MNLSALYRLSSSYPLLRGQPLAPRTLVPVNRSRLHRGNFCAEPTFTTGATHHAIVDQADDRLREPGIPLPGIVL
ncbi:hypothetical protein ANRL3_00851 [Anaerolineae bacterium]|nr:hypothetical protein ANRL3_00851 [Anaerolineae bacterium]